MNISYESFCKFLYSYCENDWKNLSLQSQKTEKLNDLTRNVCLYGSSNQEFLEIHDILPNHCTEFTPIYILNFQDEMAEGGLDDYLIHHLVTNNVRVFFAKHSYYQNKELDREFQREGLPFWKKNIASQLIGIQYLKEQGALFNVNGIGMNGLGSCLLAALYYHGISCNTIHIINGLIDFNQIANNGIWNCVFNDGFYYGLDSQSVKNTPELQFLNPSMLFLRLQAQQKIYYTLDNFEPVEPDKNMIIKRSEERR